MTATPLRVGIVGANAVRGWARDAHLRAIRAVPGLTIGSVSSRTQEIADEAAVLFGAATATDDSPALARDPAVDVVAVLVKVPEHREIVLAALEAGKHVYCEWPLGRDVAEAEEMASAARRAGTHVAIGTQALHAAAVRRAREFVRAGTIGAPLSLRVVAPTAGWGSDVPPHYEYLQDRSNGATLATIAGGHALATIEAIAGRYVELSAIAPILTERVRIVGEGRTIARTCADHLLVIGRHAGGCVSSLEVIGHPADAPFRFELRGRDGTLSITGGSPGGFQAGELTLSASSGDPVAGPPPIVPGAAANVAAAWSAFVDDIKSGRRSVPDFDDAVRLSRLLDAIDRAAASGDRVAIQD